MANYFSTWFADPDSNGLLQTALAKPRKKPSNTVWTRWGSLHRYIVSLEHTTPTAGDTVRLLTLPSSARITGILKYNSAAGTGGLGDCGVFYAGLNHDGAAIDDNCLADNIGVTSFNRAAEILSNGVGSSSISLADIGKPLWWMASFSTGTFTEDPRIDLDIVWSWLGTPSAFVDFALAFDVIMPGT